MMPLLWNWRLSGRFRTGTTLAVVVGVSVAAGCRSLASARTAPVEQLCRRSASTPVYSPGGMAAIAGEAYSIEGRPLASTMVELRRLGAEVRDTGVVADETGFFRIDGIARGSYLLTARSIGYYAQTDSIAVHENYVVRLCVVLTEAIVPIHEYALR